MKKSEELLKKWIRYEKKWEWRNFWFHKIVRRNLFERFFHYDIAMPRYAGKRVMGTHETNEWIRKKIESGEPFMVARFGNTELQNMVCFHRVCIKGQSDFSRKEFDKWFERLSIFSGFFPSNEDLLEQFVEEMIKASKQVDLLAMWHCYMEDYMITEYLPDAKLSYLVRIEPWRASNPWSKALQGKKVLVIHPFDESIRRQYTKRKQLFPNPDILPEFELITLKAVQTIAGTVDERFQNWFEALEYMYREAMSIDFDIAILGCGAYGMPLAAKLKAAGKQAIHMGGATQLLFGIKGKRWVESPMVKINFNDAWEYPLETETPSGSNAVEGNCYWK